jgi:hypothetical protein
MAAAAKRALELTCFGVGEGWPCSDRRHSSFLYSIGGAHILVDAGEGLSGAYKASGRSYEQVDRVLLSHLHSDHVGSLSMWFQGLWLEGRRRPLAVSAPAGGIDPIRSWLEATLLFPDLIRFPVSWEAIDPRQPVQCGDVRIQAFPTTHLESLRRSFQAKNPRGVFDCFSFVFEHEGLRVGHSSDIGDVNDLEPLLQAPLDLLVCELSHVSPAELFLKLRGRPIGRLVLVHLARELWSGRTALKSQARRALGSAIPVSVAGDGDVFRI